MSAEASRRNAVWIYAIAAVLLAMGVTGVVNLFSAAEARIGGKDLGNVLLYLAPGLIASAAFTLWASRLRGAGASREDLHALSKRLGWIALILIFVVPAVAAIGVSVTMKAEAGWTFIFVPAYVSFGAGLAALIFSGVLSQMRRNRE